MHYLSGTKNPATVESMMSGEIGLLQTPALSYRLDGVAVWALDNGCFTDKYPGDEEYLRLMSHWSDHRDRCLFAAAPDVVGDAQATLLRSAGMYSRIRAAGYSPALVGQDGMENMLDQIPFDEFDWLFVGGSTEWKMGPARELIVEAQRRGKKIHVGRVNSRRRYRIFAGLGCDSADGTYIAFGPDINHLRVLSWVREHHNTTTEGATP